MFGSPKVKKKYERPSPSGRVVYSAMLAACGTDGHGFEPRPEPPPMLVDTSVSTWIKKAQLPC